MKSYMVISAVAATLNLKPYQVRALIASGTFKDVKKEPGKRGAYSVGRQSVYDYKKKDEAAQSIDTNKGCYVIVRSPGAGVYAGYLCNRFGELIQFSDLPDVDTINLSSARQLNYWEGAGGCMQVSVDGISNPDSCRLTVLVGLIKIYQVVEVIPCTERGRKNIQAIRAWEF